MGKYSETMMDHVLSPRNGGVLEQPDLTGHAGTPGRGAFLILFLKVEEGRIQRQSITRSAAGRRSRAGRCYRSWFWGGRSRNAES